MAFVLNWLTLDGGTSATLFGIIALGFGGWTGAAVTLAFFISSSLLSRDLVAADESVLAFRRDGMQVWANGFWFALWLIIWYLSQQPVFLIAAVTSMAFSTADTWGSEIGANRVKRPTWLIHNFEEVKPGADGGISIFGTIASFLGAAFITAIFWLLNRDFSWTVLLVIVLGGFIGSLIDSWIGAKVQGRKFYAWVGQLLPKKYSHIDNNMTNWLAAGGASIIALLITLIITF